MSSEGSSCIKLETRTLIFGVSFSVINVFLILIAIGEMITFNTTPLPHMQPNGYVLMKNGMKVPHETHMLFMNIGFALAILKFGLNLTFTVLLCVGVTKRKPSYIKAYYIYGIVMVVLASLVMLGMVVVQKNVVNALLYITMLALFSFSLHMVYLTRLKILSGEVYGFEHKRLDENAYKVSGLCTKAI